MGLISPNEMLANAKEHMLDGREPSGRKDQMLLLNFVAANTKHGLEIQVTKLMLVIYPDVFADVTEDDAQQIAVYQAVRYELSDD